MQLNNLYTPSINIYGTGPLLRPDVNGSPLGPHLHMTTPKWAMIGTTNYHWRCATNPVTTTHVENFNKCWKCVKITMMWQWHDPFHQFGNIIKTDIINEDHMLIWCYMHNFVEILCLFEGKFACWQLLHNLHATNIFWFNFAGNFLYFLSISLDFLGIFHGIKKLRTFERNPCFWDSYLMPWTWNNEPFLRVLKIFTSLFPNKYG